MALVLVVAVGIVSATLAAGPSAQREHMATVRLLAERLLGAPPHDIIAGTLPVTDVFAYDVRGRLSVLNPGAALDPRSDAERALRMQGICVLAATNCPGEFDGDTRGAEAADCVAFMQTKSQGPWNRANSDTVTCRELHSCSRRSDPRCTGRTSGRRAARCASTCRTSRTSTHSIDVDPRCIGETRAGRTRPWPTSSPVSV